jgi:hypothetical protein
MVAKYAMRMTLPKAQSKSNREKNRNRNLGIAGVTDPGYSGYGP